MPKCIICQKEHTNTTIEHIVPRSLGNIHYILPKGTVCSNCNNRFARFEHDVVSSKPFIERRRQAGVILSQPPATPFPLSEKALKLFLLKVAYESTHRSKKELLVNLHLDGVRHILLDHSINITTELIQGYKPKHRLPKMMDHWRLRGSGIRLYLDLAIDSALFTFSYYDMSFSIDIKKAAHWRLYNL